MAYTIKKTDGSILLNLADGKVDQLSTSISLIGKNVEPYGQYYNNNLIGLIENFSSVEQPRAPLHGQLWFNKLDGRLYVYGLDNLFKPVAGAQLSATQPTLFGKGDLWVDTVKKQLWFSADGGTFTLAGPQYSATEGKSGWVVETVSDSTNLPRTIASLYSNNTLLGIVSAEAFSFNPIYQGMSSVSPGFTLNPSIPNNKFVGTATSAESVNGFTPDLYVKRNVNETTSGTFSVLNNNGLSVGAAQDVSIITPSAGNIISSNIANKSIKIRVTNTANGYVSAIYVNANPPMVGILTETPAAELDVAGSVNLSGALKINGASILTSPQLGVIDASDNRITGVATPLQSNDVVNKQYVDLAVDNLRKQTFSVTIDIETMTTPNAEIVPLLEKLLPILNPAEDSRFNLPNESRARVLCITTRTPTITYIVKEFKVVSGAWTYVRDIA